MKITRVLPEQSERVETCVTRFGDDWPGLFIRGDDCLRYAMSLSEALNSGYGVVAHDRAVLKHLLELLQEANTNGRNFTATKQ